MDNGGLYFLTILLVALVLVHIRKMAEIKSRTQQSTGDSSELRRELAAMKSEVAELKEMVHTQMLALDRYSRDPVAPPADAEVRNRVSAG